MRIALDEMADYSVGNGKREDDGKGEYSWGGFCDSSGKVRFDL